MTTIRLGTGADAVDVEDGASVPLCNGSVGVSTRGDARLVNGKPVVIWYDNTHQRIGFVGELGLIAFAGWSVDLAALRRERTPKAVVVGGWCVVPRDWHDQSRVMTLPPRDAPVCAQDPDRRAVYWTHRPGNWPELQAAFDAAVEALLSVPSDDPWKVVEVRAALMSHARALGYGKP